MWQSRRLWSSVASPAVSRYGVALDIDGVLVRGRHLIPGANRALQLLRERRVPHVLLTNGGGIPETDFASALARKGVHGVAPEQIVLSHTPSREWVRELGSEALVVVMGRKRPVDAARHYGFANAVTPEQYCAVHNLFPFEQYPADLVPPRLRDLIRTTPVAAAMVYSDPLMWGRDIQLLVDLFSDHPPGGLPARTRPPRVLFCNADLHWSHSFPAPRFGQGAFIEAAMAVYRRHFSGAEMPHQVMGKPSKTTYDYCTLALGPCERYYGVGDNQLSDIAGANAAGHRWRSVLVKTGLYTGAAPPHVRPHYLVADVLEAVETIDAMHHHSL